MMIKEHRAFIKEGASYNGDAVVVNVSSLVKLFLKLGVTLTRPTRQLVTMKYVR
jgi:hypothetical protein